MLSDYPSLTLFSGKNTGRRNENRREPFFAEGNRGAAEVPGDRQEICRVRAEKCKEWAESARHPEERSVWLTLADEWLQIAENTPRFRMVGPPVLVAEPDQ